MSVYSSLLRSGVRRVLPHPDRGRRLVQGKSPPPCVMMDSSSSSSLLIAAFLICNLNSLAVQPSDLPFLVPSTPWFRELWIGVSK